MTNHILEDIMTAASIHHRPAGYLAAGAVAAIVAGSVAFSVAHHDSAPANPAQISVQDSTPRTHFHPTTSGGRVMIGQ
jgi:hypothetical protein